METYFALFIFLDFHTVWTGNFHHNLTRFHTWFIKEMQKNPPNRKFRLFHAVMTLEFGSLKQSTKTSEALAKLGQSLYSFYYSFTNVLNCGVFIWDYKNYFLKELSKFTKWISFGNCYDPCHFLWAQRKIKKKIYKGWRDYWTKKNMRDLIHLYVCKNHTIGIFSFQPTVSAPLKAAACILWPHFSVRFIVKSGSY